MKKFSFLSSLLICLLGLVMFTSVFVFADSSTIAVLTSYVEFPKFREAIFEKPTEVTAVGNVSGIEKLLKIETQIDFGMYKTAEKAELLYYFDGEDSSNPHSSVYDGEIQNKKSFYLSTNKEDFPASSSHINYQIKVTFKKENDDSIGSAYWPTQLTTSSDTFHPATISTSTSTYITGSEGGTITYDDGNQEYPDTGVTFEAGDVNGNGNVYIEEVSFEDFFAGLFPVSGIARSAALKAASSLTYGEIDWSKRVGNFVWIHADDGVSIEHPGAGHLSYASSDTTATKFDVLFTSNGASFKYITVTSIDKSQKLVHFPVAEWGYYILMVSSNLDDNDYRPEKRVRVKSRIANGTYEGFKFGNLEEGDVVKIFNLNGKKIAELTAGSSNGFVWKGKKDTNNSGDWAESGTYVYQIKLKEKGKIISGTIAFVW